MAEKRAVVQEEGDWTHAERRLPVMNGHQRKMERRWTREDQDR